MRTVPGTRLRRWSLGIVWLAALLPALAGCDVLRSPEQRGVLALQRGEYGRADDAFSEAIDRATAAGDQEALAVAYANRCFARDALGEHTDAVTDCTAALDIKPDDPEIINNRGVAYLNNSMDEEAEADFTAAIALRPDYAEAYANRGRVHIDREAFALALADLDKAIELDDNLPEAYANRAFVNESLDRVDDALADYGQAIERRPDAQILFYRGMLLLQQGRFAEALDDFKRAQEIDPESYVAYQAGRNVEMLSSNPDLIATSAAATPSSVSGDAASTETPPLTPADEVVATPEGAGEGSAPDTTAP